MAEPSALLTRILALEKKLQRVSAQAANARAHVSFLQLLIDEVLLPEAISSAGQARKTLMLNSLQSVMEQLSDHPAIPGPIASLYEDEVRDWQSEVLAVPEWRPLPPSERTPDPTEED